MPYQPQRGDRIRIIRYDQAGRRRSVHTGTVLSIDTVCGEPSINFLDDRTGRRVAIAPNETYATYMKGCRQTIEPA